MITISKKGNVVTFKGHSGYETLGKDIVCAAVSSITCTTINALLKLNAKSIKVLDYGQEMKIKILKNDDSTEILINNMLDMLKELKEQYPENIGGEF